MVLNNYKVKILYLWDIIYKIEDRSRTSRASCYYLSESLAHRLKDA